MTERFVLYNGDVNLDYDNNKHIYWVGDNIVYGVTSIIGVIDKPALKQWAANKAVDHIQERILPGNKYDEIQLSECFKGARSAFRSYTSTAADFGTLVHAWLEEYLKAGIAKKPLPSLPENVEMREAIQGLLNWTKENNVKFVSSERKIYSRKYSYAGTLDAEAIVNGKLTIIDFKTSSGIYPEMFIQTSAYLKAREEESGVKYPGGLCICRLAKIIGNSFEVKQVKDVSRHFKSFRGAHEIYKWQQRNKQLELLEKAKPSKIHKVKTYDTESKA